MPKAEFSGGVNDDVNAFSIDVEFLSGNLKCHGVNPLSHLGPAMSHLDSAVVTEMNNRSTYLPEPVSESGVLHADRKTDRSSFRAGPVVIGFDGIEAFTCAASAVIHYLAGPPGVSRGDHVLATKLPRVDTCDFRQTVDDTLGCELGLVGTETSECAADRVVCANRSRFDIERLPAVGAGNMAGSTFEHFHADACVGPRVSDRPHVQTGQDPIGIAAGPDVKSDRMTFCVHAETFDPAQGALDGVAE